MSLRRAHLTRIARGSATLTALAALMMTGFAVPAQAAEGVPFTPDVKVSLQPASTQGADVPILLTLNAASGESWMTTGGANVPLTVHIDVYGSYPHGTVPTGPAVPSGTAPAASGTFVATNGAGPYVLNASNFSLGGFKYGLGDYTIVASVLKADGSNASYITSDVSSPFGTASSITNITSSVVVVPPINRPLTGGTPSASPSPSPTTATPTPTSTAGTGTFANCAAALAAGVTDIKKGDLRYVAAQDRNNDGIACASNGSDAAVTINGGFTHAAEVDHTPFIIGCVAAGLGVLGFGIAFFMRHHNKEAK